VKLLLFRLRFQVVRLELRWDKIKQTILELLVQRWVLKGDSLFNYFIKTQPYLRKEKQKLIEQSSGRKVIYFTFRTLHFLDWFAPIDLALKRSFPEKYEVFYIDFSTTLHRIGKGFEYLRFRQQVEERLLQLNISPLCHFSHDELAGYKSFPEASVHLTCESIRQETFSVADRIYLPHYALPKAIDLDLPKNIHFNHVFLPTRPPYTYNQLNDNSSSDSDRLKENLHIHYVGYPKLQAVAFPVSCFPDSDHPVVLYAPSLELSLLFDALGRGLLKIFKKISHCNFVIKLHPSLASRRNYVTAFISQELKGAEHIRFDELNGIQNLAGESSLMITDFGSVGGEYRLGFGKPVVFLKTPAEYEGGSDLRFRDDFADAICEVEDLENAILSVMKKGALSYSELQNMRQQVLSFSGVADEEAARAINAICSTC
jgi:hypothetical protein